MIEMKCIVIKSMPRFVAAYSMFVKDDRMLVYHITMVLGYISTGYGNKSPYATYQYVSFITRWLIVYKNRYKKIKI